MRRQERTVRGHSEPPCFIVHSYILGRPPLVLYAFDPKRQAVLLLGADKTGLSDDRFYRTYGPRAEALWEEYLREMEG